MLRRPLEPGQAIVDAALWDQVQAVENLLAQRNITFTYETIRQWCLTFGLDYARTLRRGVAPAAS